MNPWVAKWMKIYLKCFINLILYHRNVYPAVSFDFTTYQAFDLPQFTPINRHPGLQEYIEELVLDILSKLIHIYGLSLCIITKEDNICIERYVLSFHEFRHVDAIGVLTETEVFDEFRSCLNSLIAHLEKKVPLKDDVVSFEVVINTMDMQLGRKPESLGTLKSKDDLLAFDRDVNWTKYQEDEGYPNSDESLGIYNPKIKMTSLVGCDVGPLIIQQHCEMLLAPEKTLGNFYCSTQKESPFSSL